MSDVKLVVAAIVHDSEIAGPFIAQRAFIINSNEDFATKFAEFRAEFELDDFKIVHAVVLKIEVVDGFAVVLSKED